MNNTIQYNTIQYNTIQYNTIQKAFICAIFKTVVMIKMFYPDVILGVKHFSIPPPQNINLCYKFSEKTTGPDLNCFA